jgi:hypothetical protein
MVYYGNVCFNGYFIVNTNTNVVQAVYAADNQNINILSPVGTWGVAINGYEPGWLSFNRLGLRYLPYFSYNTNTMYDFYGNNPATFGWSYVENSNNYLPYGNSSQMFFNIALITTPPFVCFMEDSRILTNKGYRPIQELRKGDLIKTLKNDFVPIDMIGARDVYHPKSAERIKDQLYVCSQDKFPEVFQDLVITGCHCILVDDFKDGEREKTKEVNGKIYVTDNKYRLPACVDERTRIYEKEGMCTIYHIALENDDYYMNYGIYANGLLVETCSKRYLKELSQMKLLE